MALETALRERPRCLPLRAWYAAIATRVQRRLRINRGIAPSDLKNLSIFRAVFGLVLLGNWFLNLRPCFYDLYSDGGLLPAEVLISQSTNFHAAIVWLGRFLGMDLLFPVLYPVVLCGFVFGYRTRAANFLLLISHVYLASRMPYATGAADDLIRLVLLWCLFLPLNRYWSIDVSGETQSRNRFHPALPLLCIKVQVVSVYFFSGLFKLATPEWLDGSAIQRIFKDNTFAGAPWDLALATHAPTLLSLATWGVVALQISSPLLICATPRRSMVRIISLVSLGLLHGSFTLFLQVGVFPYLSLAMLVLLLPPEMWRAIATRRAHQPLVWIFYDPNCRFCHRIALLIAGCTATARSRVAPASDDPEAARAVVERGTWLVRCGGRSYTKWRAVALLLRFNPVLAPLGIVSDTRTLQPTFERVYDWIGRNRSRFGVLSGWFLPFQTERSLSRFNLALCSFLAIAAFYGNIATAEWTRLGQATYAEPYSSLKEAPLWIDYLQVRQRWNLFAPAPTQYRRSFTIEAQTSVGHKDINSVLSHPVFWHDGYQLNFRTPSWRKLFTYLTSLDVLSASEWAAFGQYWCRQAQMSGLTDVSAIRFRSFLAESEADGDFGAPVMSIDIPCAYQAVRG